MCLRVPVLYAYVCLCIPIPASTCSCSCASLCVCNVPAPSAPDGYPRNATAPAAVRQEKFRPRESSQSSKMVHSADGKVTSQIEVDGASVYSAATGELVFECRGPQGSQVQGIHLSPRGTFLITCTRHGPRKVANGDGGEGHASATWTHQGAQGGHRCCPPRRPLLPPLNRTLAGHTKFRRWRCDRVPQVSCAHSIPHAPLLSQAFLPFPQLSVSFLAFLFFPQSSVSFLALLPFP